ncbi:LysR family transcriptional regulator [Vagococcus fluvialis]|uniref:LysR family transcriptional regulator n=1 Tax=Vagococcus fluvialis TaxID=2738 RepID=UPI002FDAFA4A
MNIKDLTYFNHLAKTLSFTETASYFYISQPSISMAIKRLEEELDTLLIDRKNNHKKLALTETGLILLKYSEQIITSIEQAHEEIHDFNHQIVYFGLLPTIGGHFMPQLLPKLGKYADSLKLIEEESSDAMMELVRDGEVPLAIIASDFSPVDPYHIMQIPLQQEEMSAWVSLNNPLAKKKRLLISDIKNTSCISLEKGYLHERVFQKWLDDNHMKKPQVLYTKEIRTAVSVASSTNMVAFMSDIIVPKHAPLVKVPIENAPNILISLIVNQSRNFNQFQKSFNDAVVDLTKGIG